MIVALASDQQESSMCHIPSTNNQVEKVLDPYFPTHRSFNLPQNLQLDDASNTSADFWVSTKKILTPAELLPESTYPSRVSSRTPVEGGFNETFHA
jgi:hypothetical protein